MRNVINLLVLIILSSCTITSFHKETVGQHLTVRKDYKGFLVNEICSEEKNGKCRKTSVVIYDMADQKVRETLNKLKFLCKVGGERYHICQDKPGFCRDERVCIDWDHSWFSDEKTCDEYEVKSFYYDSSQDHDFLVKGYTECSVGL